MELPALNISYCKCKAGFKATDDNRCEISTCPALVPPDNGYFVDSPNGCGRVLNTACGARCKPGYQLTGSSIRLCQENGTWSGTETECVRKCWLKWAIYMCVSSIRSRIQCDILSLLFQWKPVQAWPFHSTAWSCAKTSTWIWIWTTRRATRHLWNSTIVMSCASPNQCPPTRIVHSNAARVSIWSDRRSETVCHYLNGMDFRQHANVRLCPNVHVRFG